MFAVLLCGFLSAPPPQPAEVPDPLYLWPAGAPGAVGDEEVDKPCIFVYHPDEAVDTGAAIVVCPGGGYAGLAMDYEGHHIAKYFQARGVTAALLRYRLCERYHHPAPLHDVSRALRTIRHHGDEWQVDSDRVGVIGFSAGGHLASTIATHYDRGKEDAADPIDRQSCRPDFTLLCYPVISFVAPYSHSGSARRLLGANATDEELRSLSNELHVTEDTPPAFLFHTGGDSVVPPQNSLAYAAACVSKGVPCELHLFQNGPHGVGMALKDPAASHWPKLAITWMKQSGFLTSEKRVEAAGHVTLNGKPLRSGEVVFISQDSNAPSAATRFGGGRFRFTSDNGPVVGKATVQILLNSGAGPLPAIERAIEVTPNGGIEVEVRETDNNFMFDLQSD